MATSSNSAAGPDTEGDGLRERKPHQQANFGIDPESEDSVTEDEEKDKKTVGRTPDGTGEYLQTHQVHG